MSSCDFSAGMARCGHQRDVAVSVFPLSPTSPRPASARANSIAPRIDAGLLPQTRPSSVSEVPASSMLRSRKCLRARQTARPREPRRHRFYTLSRGLPPYVDAASDPVGQPAWKGQMTSSWQGPNSHKAHPARPKKKRERQIPPDHVSPGLQGPAGVGRSSWIFGKASRTGSVVAARGRPPSLTSEGTGWVEERAGWQRPRSSSPFEFRVKAETDWLWGLSLGERVSDSNAQALASPSICEHPEGLRPGFPRDDCGVRCDCLAETTQYPRATPRAQAP